MGYFSNVNLYVADMRMRRVFQQSLRRDEKSNPFTLDAGVVIRSVIIFWQRRMLICQNKWLVFVIRYGFIFDAKVNQMLQSNFWVAIFLSAILFMTVETWARVGCTMSFLSRSASKIFVRCVFVSMPSHRVQVYSLYWPRHRVYADLNCDIVDTTYRGEQG